VVVVVVVAVVVRLFQNTSPLNTCSV